MYPRVKYEMTEADLEKLLNASKPTPVIKVGNYMPSGPQENANRAWAELGARMGFDSMTVQPDPDHPASNRFFTAVPRETPEQLEERRIVKQRAERKIRKEQLKHEINRLNCELSELQEHKD